MKSHVLKGHYVDESGILSAGKLVVIQDGNTYVDEAGEQLSAKQVKATDNLKTVHIGTSGAWVFCPNAGECERIGLPVAA